MTAYTKKAAQRATIKSNEEKIIDQAVKLGFPNCKGTYPDCPEKPTKEHPICRICPVLEEILEKEE
jgi:hypothetical protein